MQEIISENECTQAAGNVAGLAIHHGDALTVLRTLPESSFNCCVTSPPYYGLRDYGTTKWEGGVADCRHIKGTAASTSDVCRRCGAKRIDNQIGLEKTPAEYIARLVDVFREVRRVLANDGTLWVNIGDSYNAQPGQRKQGVERNDVAGWKQQTNTGCLTIGSRSIPGLKPKDLIGIPWMLAFALREDGWYLRQDIIWHKPNPMPESVKDRCTKAHEYLFLLSKNGRYFYDADAISEESTGRPPGNRTHKYTEAYESGDEKHRTKAGLLRYSFKRREDTPPGQKPQRREDRDQEFYDGPLRNRRSVWSLTTMATPEAHFATFPLELPELCIRAGCPADGVVLDPFAGAGTTGLACLKNGRRFVGIELNAEYIEIAHARARKYYPMFCELPA